ncbi:MAG: acetamidase/formamidase family protein [Ilumatobacteraceae bacterium]
MTQVFGINDLKYTYSSTHVPIGSIRSGEIFQVETEDCFTNRFNDPSGFTTENLSWVMDNLDGVTGPIVVEGAKPGDVVAITIHEIEITSDGIVALSPCDLPTTSDWWGQWYACESFPISNGYLRFSDKINIPINPIIGCIATAPARETVLSKMQGQYGGNMDCNEVSVGATILLPVSVPGAYIYFGDAKAVMGDGEIVQAPEVSTRITASVEIRQRPINMDWPRIETMGSLITVVSDRSLENAVGIAFAQLLDWVVTDYKMERERAALLLAMVSQTGICQTANSLPTGRCLVSRAFLPRLM